MVETAQPRINVWLGIDILISSILHCVPKKRIHQTHGCNCQIL